MPLFKNQTVPNLALAPKEYSQQYQDQLNNILRLFFTGINAVQQIDIARLNIDLNTLPTEADFNTLRLGDVYRDTQDGVQAGSQMLRIKTATNVVYLTGVTSSGSSGTVTP